MIETAALPGTEARLTQAVAAERVLLACGYRAVGMDHFALPDDPLFRFAEAGNLRRNFQGYTTDQAEVLLGLGLSAIGTLPQGYAQNDKDAVQYAKALRAGRSEEHTSELQSLMRISYAVFCLYKTRHHVDKNTDLEIVVMSIV